MALRNQSKKGVVTIYVILVKGEIHATKHTFFFSCFLWHMVVPRLGVELEPHLLAYTTAIETLDPSHICNLRHSSRQG